MALVAAVQRSHILNNTEEESRRRGRNHDSVRVGEAERTTVEAGWSGDCNQVAAAK